MSQPGEKALHIICDMKKSSETGWKGWAIEVTHDDPWLENTIHRNGMDECFAFTYGNTATRYSTETKAPVPALGLAPCLSPARAEPVRRPTAGSDCVAWGSLDELRQATFIIG
jgi:hypothetical protein